jgi:acyl-CoA thioester hydrolase
LTDFRHRTRLDVRFRDIDAFGHVNNAVFSSYLEQARIGYLLDALESPRFDRLPLILARVELDYRAPILFGDPIEVLTRIDWIGRSSIAMSHELLAAERLAAQASTVLVTYDYEIGKPMPVPDDWRRRFAAVEGRALERPVPASSAT